MKGIKFTKEEDFYFWVKTTQTKNPHNDWKRYKCGEKCGMCVRVDGRGMKCKSLDRTVI